LKNLYTLKGDDDLKRKERRKKDIGTRKDIGYVMFEQEANSEEEELVTDAATKYVACFLHYYRISGLENFHAVSK